MSRTKLSVKKNAPKAGKIGYAFLFHIFLFGLTGIAAPANPNAAPPTMPSLREWSGGTGFFTFGTNSLIVVDNQYTNKLNSLASVLKDDLKQITGRDYPIISLPEASPGSIYLTLSNSDAGIGNEGYILQMDESVTIQANTGDGVFHGAQTVLQLLKLEATHSRLPRGRARDYPLCQDRDEMIDVGRHFYQVNYLEEEIRKLAWYKMNTLHLHFTDWNGFRLVSDTYPGLATSPAYTKADIRRLQDVARRYHVTIVPEIDLPAHAKAITDYDPQLRFSCASMDTGHWPGAHDGGWMLDITRPDVREWIRKLLDEFIPLFDGPYFHIGCDEWEYTASQSKCPELIAYMKAKGYASPTDVFVEWINEMNQQVKSHGKITQIWNWWDFKQTTRIQPDKDIVVNSWTASPDKFLKNGWKVICTPEEELYVAPGTGGTEPGKYGYFDSKRIYEDWKMPSDPNLIGFKVCRWSDNAEERSDAWFDHWAQRPVQVLAERTWGGPRSATANDFYERADAIGYPPELPKSSSK
jgi:N-acetyl-beta-hexosaminidase